MRTLGSKSISRVSKLKRETCVFEKKFGVHFNKEGYHKFEEHACLVGILSGISTPSVEESLLTESTGIPIVKRHASKIPLV